MAELIIQSGPLAGAQVELSLDALVVGRGADCDLALDGDSTASTHHARLTRTAAGAWRVEDLGSANGTKINGAVIAKATELRHGDVLAVGSSQMLFSAPAGGHVAVAPSIPLSKPDASARPAPSAAPAPIAEKVDATAEDVKLVSQMSGYMKDIRREVAKVIVGQGDVLDMILMAMIAGGHALLVGMPGMAKTLMISTIARVLDLNFKRIQFTPDLMPTDITGTEILETDPVSQEKRFRFIQGPLFCNIMLADEINRTPPKTQAALLEAMQEKRVTVGNKTYSLTLPFFVLATQNPLEQEGTYPLPEAQMDRFMFNIWVDYPQEHEEELIVMGTTSGRQQKPEKVLSQEQILKLQEVTQKVPVSEHVVKYAIRLVRATRPGMDNSPDFIKQYVSCGAGPRAGQSLVLAAKARAILDGRIHVSCNDIRRAAIPVLRHRLFTNFAADAEGLTPMKLIDKLLETIKEPSEKDYA